LRPNLPCPFYAGPIAGSTLPASMIESNNGPKSRSD